MQSTAYDWLAKAVEAGAADVFIGAGRQMSFKINGKIIAVADTRISTEEARFIVEGLYELAKRPMDKYEKDGDDDFPITLPGLARFRVSAYKQRGTFAAVIRVVMFEIK
jgi:twitching motility protein PilT